MRPEPIDYLVIGHITEDLTAAGPLPGGTAAYAALTARALGLRVGIVSAHAPTAPLQLLEGIPVAALAAEHSTTFENLNTPTGRVQYLHHAAPTLELSLVPETWRAAPLVHLGPVAQEIDPKIVWGFPSAFIGVTPQGWLRSWDAAGRVQPVEWPEAGVVLSKANAAVLSIEDVQHNEDWIEELLGSIRILVITAGAAGARVYWNGDVRYFRAPAVTEVDPTGAGDIFATAFFVRLFNTRDPWEAARFATQIAAISVTRPGLQGVPTPAEVQTALLEILPKV
jgi:sugar/nucleoside kinase (ribokinase family)